jgi:hypothetical protein
MAGIVLVGAPIFGALYGSVIGLVPGALYGIIASDYGDGNFQKITKNILKYAVTSAKAGALIGTVGGIYLSAQMFVSLSNDKSDNPKK